MARGAGWALFGSDPLFLGTCPQNEFLGLGTGSSCGLCHSSTSLSWAQRLLPGSGSQLQALGLKGKSCAVIPVKYPLSGINSFRKIMELSLAKQLHFTRGEPTGNVTSHKPELPATR